MTNFEKIDNYLSNRLTDSEKIDFENQLEGDPSLKEEFGFQQQVMKGIQQARISELKQMLNQVPVSSPGMSSGQITAGVLSTGVVILSLYFFLRTESPKPVDPEVVPEVIVAPEVPKKNDPAVENIESPAKNENLKKDQPSREIKKSSPVSKPEIQVVDPSEEFKEAQEPSEAGTNSRSEVQPSKLEVITESSDKKHSFHYQFTEGRLLLFGPFDSNLYEILEIHGESHAVFLFYKENYYLLDESQNAIAQLVPIRDGNLLTKLREYRKR